MRRAVFLRAASALALCLTSPGRTLPALAAEPEPEAALKLFELCSSRRPGSWTADERAAVDALVDEVVALRRPWDKKMARGKWRLAYLQPGLGARQQTLDLPFNEQYQIIGGGELINVAELLGSLLEVRAAGSWREDDAADLSSPKRFRADITQGALCGSVTMGSVAKANIGRACVPLPLRGETYRVFDAQYVGSRIRIGQDLNSGGSRIVQVRVDGFSGR